MPTPDEQLLLEMLSDPEGCTRNLHRAHDAVLRGNRPPEPMRRLVAESWQRSLAAEVDPGTPAVPVAFARDDIIELRKDHALAAAMPTVERTLLSIAEAASLIVIVTDANGVVHSYDGAREVRRAAEKIGLIEGAVLAERKAGTNAIGASLAVDAPTHVHSAEHLFRIFHNWTCATCPLHDPDTGEVIGVIDISGPPAAAHPSWMTLVSTTAQLVEQQMYTSMIQRDSALRAANYQHLHALHGAGGALLSPTGRVLASEGTEPLPGRIPIGVGRVPLGDGREGIIEPLDEGYLLRLARQPQELSSDAPLSLTLLGDGPPTMVVDGHQRPLTYRHAEILALLALHPDGLTCDQLTFHLYGDMGTQATTRAEIHRLRAQLGPILATRPYRLRANVTGDLLTVHAALRAGDAHGALAAYRGSLLPRSESPTIRAQRDELHAAVRRAALKQGGADELWLLAETDLGRLDPEVLDATHHALDEDDPRRELVATRAHHVLTEE